MPTTTRRRLFAAAVLFFAAASATPAFQTASEFIDFLYTNGVQHDDQSRHYRNGEPDPRVAAVPPALLDAVFTDPVNQLPALVEWLIRDAADEYHVVKRLHDFVAHHIAYDFDMLSGRVPGRRDSSGVLADRRTTCGGFSALFAQLAELAGIEVKVVGGAAKAIRMADLSRAGHAWNVVHINQTWYIVDVTGDSLDYWEHGAPGTRLPAYSDTFLLLRPEAYLLFFYPSDPADLHTQQFISRETVLATPKLWIDAFDFGVKVDPSALPFEFGSAETNPSLLGGLHEDFDTISATGPIKIPVEVADPANTRVLAFMTGFEGDGFFKYAALDAVTERRFAAHFSPPAPGDYQSYIIIQDLSSMTIRVVYRFIFRFAGEGGTAAILPASTDDLMVHATIAPYGMQIADFAWTPPGADRTARLSIRLPNDVHAVAVTVDQHNNGDAAGIRQQVVNRDGARFLDVVLPVDQVRPWLRVYPQGPQDPAFSYPICSARLR